MGEQRQLSRRCRASQAKVCSRVSRAAGSWSKVYGEAPPFVWEGGSCSEQMKAVKSYLSSCPSSVEEERFAWQSIKKLLPASCKCMEGPLVRSIAESLSRPPIDLPAGYRSYARLISSQLFSKGWDSTYLRQAVGVSPPLSGCVESGRQEGGSLGYAFGGHSAFLDAVFGNTEFVGDCRATALVVQSAGKPRPLTKFSHESLLLRPLHGAMYDFLSTKKWLLRGDLTSSALDRAGFREELGVLTSGDYRSATDNLPIEIAEVVLEEARKGAVFVPDSVWEYAFAMLRPKVDFFDEEDGSYDSFDVTRGQMMGSYLSFPLLCVQNYIAFRWSRRCFGIKEHLPLLINGDDILFQSSSQFSEAWMTVVGSVGLEVESTKTSVSAEFGSLNSTLVRWHSGRLRVSPTLRMGMLRPRDYLNGIGRDFSSFVRGVPPGVAWTAGKEFFKWHVAAIRSSGRLTAAEWGFRGRLAWRLSEIFSLHFVVGETDWGSWTVSGPPPPPSCHDVQIPAELVERVPAGSLSEELEALNASQMTCWKWSHQISLASSAIRYCVALSSMRWERRPYYPSPRKKKDDEPSRTFLKKRFFLKSESPKILFFSELLRLQDFSEYESLPPYSQVELEFRLDEAGKSKE